MTISMMYGERVLWRLRSYYRIQASVPIEMLLYVTLHLRMYGRTNTKIRINREKIDGAFILRFENY